MRNTFYAFSFLLAAGLTAASGVMAQAEKTSGGPLGLTWEELGPNNMGTKVRAMAFDNSGNLYAGSVGGGLWKSTNLGVTWSQVTSLTQNMIVSSIAINGSNIYLGTGEVFFHRPSGQPSWVPGVTSNWDIKQSFWNNTSIYGEGVVVSTDGGATWDHDNGTWNGSSVPYTGAFRSIQKVASRGGRTFVATMQGLYYSDDADLTNVVLVNGTNTIKTQPIVEVEFGSGTTVWAATKDSLFVSNDNGSSWGPAINSIIPVPNVTPLNGRLGGARIEVAVSPSTPTTVYVTGVIGTTSNNTGVYKTTDNGTTWSRVADYENGPYQPCKENGLYSVILEVDPADPNSYFLGGFRLYSYDDADGLLQVGTTTYVPGASTKYVPNPIHALVFNPSNPDQFFVAGDEEIVRTDDRGETFTFKTKGFNCGHFWNVSAAANYRVLGGERYQGLVEKATGNSDPAQQQWTLLYNDVKTIGRYFVNNFDWIIAQSTDGGLERSLLNGSTFERFYNTPIAPRHPSLDADSTDDQAFEGASLKDAGGAPVTPWVIDNYIHPDSLVNDTSILNHPVWIYMCSRKYVWVVTNPMGGIDSVPRWNRLTPRSNNIVNIGTDPREYFTAITVSPDGNHTVVAATNYGKVIRILNANDPVNMDITVNLCRMDTNTAGWPTRWVTDLEFDPKNSNNLIVTFGGYESSDPDRIWISNNALAAASDIEFHPVDDLPSTMPVYCAAFHPTRQAVMVGTEEGLFTSSDDWNGGGALTWNNESNPFGRVPVYDIYIRPYYKLDIDADNWRYAPDHTIFIATHGRGVWKTRTLVAEETPEGPLDVSISLYPNPFQGQSTVAFTVPQSTEVTLEVYNLAGMRMGVIANGAFSAGRHEVVLNAAGYEAGVYLVKATFHNENGSYTKTLKSVVIR